MPATFLWSQTNGSGTTVTDLADTGNIINFKSIDDATASNYASNLITGSDSANSGNSYEVYLRAKFGTGSNISNLRFWMDTNFLGVQNGSAVAGGLTLNYGGTGTVTFAAPTRNDSSAATVVTPSSQPIANNIRIGGSANGTLGTAGGYSSYQVLQLHVSTAAGQGATSPAIFKLIYDEA